MDLSQAWNNFSNQAQSAWGNYANQAQTAWNDYKNPVLSDSQMDFLNPQANYNLPLNSDGLLSTSAGSYTPWGSGSAGLGDILNMDKWSNNALGGLSTEYSAPNLGEAGFMGGLATDFKNSSFKDQASTAAGVVNAGVNAYNAYNTTKMANKQFEFQKNVWNKNYEANKNLTNASLSDRQNARVASNPNAYQSVDSYMKKYGVK